MEIEQVLEISTPPVSSSPREARRMKVAADDQFGADLAHAARMRPRALLARGRRSLRLSNIGWLFSSVTVAR
jgi:hypothetical protein